jgi:hypothetical protein
MAADFLNVDATNLQADINQVMIGEIEPLNVDSQRALVRVARDLVSELVARARAKADGDVLQVCSGRFIDSIHGDVVVENPDSHRSAAIYFASGGVTHEGVFAEVLSDDPKAHILEYGATIPRHEIDANTAHALRFLAHEGIVFAASVQFPGAIIPPHSTIHAAFFDMEDEIVDRLESAAGTL